MSPKYLSGNKHEIKYNSVEPNLCVYERKIYLEIRVR